MFDPVFQERLLPGERLIWTGRPGQGLLLVPRDVFLIPFSLLWCGFAIFWTFSATDMGAPLFFTLWGMMVVSIGLYFVAGRFLMDAWLRRSIRYAITSRRILIVRPYPFAKFTAVNRTQLPDIDLAERSNGRGTIRFGRVVPLLGWGHQGFGGWSPALDPTPQFIAIEDAHRIFNLLQQTDDIAA